MKSMTAYLCDQLVLEDSYIFFEIRSVNNKYFNLNLSLEDSLKLYGPRIEKILKEKVSRGSIDFKISIKPYSHNPYKLDLKDAKSAYENLNLIKRELSLEGPITMSDIFSYIEKTNNFQEVKVQGLDEDKLYSFIDSILDNFNESRANEGNRLENALLIKLNSLAEDLDFIKIEIPSLNKDIYDNLKDILMDISDSNTDVINNRLCQDFVGLLNKTDIDEEITRLDSHIRAFDETMKTKGPNGKKLDFIWQELLREANTIGSKSRNENIVHVLIDMKTTIEQMREQVQNIE